jgi:hypothetical protein
MPKTVQASIAAGEVSPRMAERFDLPQYSAMVQEATNRLVTLEGANVRAPGTLLIDLVHDEARRHRLVTFKRSETQSFVLEFGHQTLRIFDAATGDPVPVDVSGTEFVLETPYDEDDIDSLYWWQSVSVMWLTHKSSRIAPYVLTRFVDASWGIKPYRIELGPFLPRNFRETIRIKADKELNDPDDPADVITLTATEDIFEPGHAGGLWRLFIDNYGFPYQAWTPGPPIDNGGGEGRQGEYIQHEGRVYQIQVDNGDREPFNQSPPVHDQGSVAQAQRTGTNDILKFNYQHDGQGIVRIDSVIDPRTATARLEPTIGNRLPERLLLDDGSNGWQIGAYSDRYGFPAIGTIFQQRLTFMGTIEAPDTFDMSRPEAYDPDSADFRPNRGNFELNDDHAVRRTFADGELNSPSWMVASDRLYVGTEKGIIAIAGPSIDEPISPNGASARPLFGVPGSSYRCLGIDIGFAIVYASKDGAKLYALYPDYSYRELLKFARHTGDSPITELQWVPAPLNLLAVRRADGRLYLITFEQQDDIVAPVQYVPGGLENGGPPVIEAIASAPDEKRVDRLWMIVQRTVNGQTRRTIERMSRDWNPRVNYPDEAVHVSCGTVYDGWYQGAATILISAPGDPFRDEPVTVTASDTVFAGRAPGDSVFLRMESVPRRIGDEGGLFSMTITAIASASEIAGTLNRDLPPALLNNPRVRFGFGAEVITGLDHLNGENVWVQGNGEWVMNDTGASDSPDFLVANGEITLSAPVVRAVVGLPHRGVTRSTRLIGDSNRGTSLFETIKSSEVFCNVSYGAINELTVRTISDNHQNRQDRIAPRTGDEAASQFPELGPLTYRATVEATRGCNVEFEILQDGVMPSEINAMGTEWERT